ncbi:HAMP domain-containing sensor histidine kinase [Desulfogranum marinum]|uniref:sensor histidine kinase n=1 Tax=Desulfogranum marinum TaxID=453220 RepID=UPI0029C63891|nr:HAMP domain-containing sensor histidine kinase [Desulfogranum marinum]
MKEQSKKKPIPPDLQRVCERVHEKTESYKQYNFAQYHNDFLKAFFDLAQEYDSLDDFYRVCVSVPYAMLGVSSALYLCQGEDEGLSLVCSSERGVLKEPEPAAFPVQMNDTPYEMADSYVIPIYSKQPFKAFGSVNAHNRPQRQTTLWNDIKGSCSAGHTLGMYELSGARKLSDADRFFFTKYANRIGYNLDNRLIARQNVQHLKFINALVVDIEHNIIVPNMYFKHIFNQLRKKIEEISGLQQQMQRAIANVQDSGECENCCRGLAEMQKSLLAYHQEMVKHHSITSLFLESLFRKEHFERGHLVLHPKQCFVEKDVIIPQLEHYASRLKAANVSVEKPDNMQQEEISLYVDIGLLAQVYANLFSNAAKYTREIVDDNGVPRKAMAYGREILDNYPEPGHTSIKFNVFTTGPCMDPEDGNNLFQEGVRGADSKKIPGTGHGLSFIRHVVEMHGGEAGYEPTSQGNNFYFILPLPPLDIQPLLLTDGT